MVDEGAPPIDDLAELECYNDCMSGTGCEFIHNREDVELLCDIVCLDYVFYGYDNEFVCIADCVDYYIVGGVDGTLGIALSCDYTLDTSLFGCRYETENESYVWDGTPVTDVNAFFENGYSMFYGESKSHCLSWFRGGTWITTVEKVGCIDYRFFAEYGCRTESIASAKTVCETIGGVFICEENDISCNI